MTITVLDPTNEAKPSGFAAADRLAQLEGATIALLDISKPRGDVFLDEIERLLKEEGATVKRFAKPTFSRPAPVDLRQQIATQCDAVIEALAD